MASNRSPQTHLFGSCACERNQYAIAIPPDPSQAQTHAHVFFDNSRATRRSQAAPLTAWLRIPLAWYHSNTQAFFPDESHASIRRTFYTPAALTGGGGGEVRKQFCGYCGTHLSASREDEEEAGPWLDVTLGSLWGESLGLLEEMGWVGGESSSEEAEEEDEGAQEVVQRGAENVARRTAAGSMSNRGMPYFEEMVENSRLGRIKRRRGGQRSADGSSMVEWEVTEIEGGDDDTVMRETVVGDVGGSGSKRLKMSD